MRGNNLNQPCNNVTEVVYLRITYTPTTAFPLINQVITELIYTPLRKPLYCVACFGEKRQITAEAVSHYFARCLFHIGVLDVVYRESTLH